jgi:hypothetical protein
MGSRKTGSVKTLVIEKPGQAKIESVPDPVVTEDGGLLQIQKIMVRLG